MTDYAYLLGFLVSLVGAGLGSYFGAYLREKGKNLATHEDINRVVRATEDIKAEISGELWTRQRRWDAKWECYSEIVQDLGELASLLEKLAQDEKRGPIPGQSSEEFERTLANTADEGVTRFRRIQRFGLKARLAVAPEVRTLLTDIGVRWNKAVGNIEQLARVDHDGWIELADMARNDLFGDPREESSGEPKT